jgi:rSAM/selenodomain-associated transferase 1
MNTSMHIAVFAKAPVAGRAKTRLIPLLGEEGAAAAQREMALRTLHTACAAAPGQVSLWAAGANDHPFFAECADRFDLVLYRQCEGDLGKRMSNCLLTLLNEHAAVLLIGTDCPAFSAADLHAAAQSLRQGRRLVFIPAEDGGYVLVGANAGGNPQERDAMLLQSFHAIDWGAPQVMAQTRHRLSQLGWKDGDDWQELPALWDVDTPDDYRRAQRANLLTSAA